WRAFLLRATTDLTARGSTAARCCFFFFAPLAVLLIALSSPRAHHRSAATPRIRSPWPLTQRISLPAQTGPRLRLTRSIHPAPGRAPGARPTGPGIALFVSAREGGSEAGQAHRVDRGPVAPDLEVHVAAGDHTGGTGVA